MTDCHFELGKPNLKGPNSNGNGPTKRKRKPGNVRVAGKRKSAPKSKISVNLEVSQGLVEISLPLVTVSEANCFEFWKKKYARHQEQKRIVSMTLNPLRHYISLPCHIKFTRIAPKKLDQWDNLPMSVKYILDAVCAIITGDFRPGRADDDGRITVSYDQKTSSEYGVIVEFTMP